LKPYRIRNVIGDNYGGEWPKEQFRKHGINYDLSEKNRSQLYLNLIPALNSKRVELPDNRKLIDELRRLERRRGRSGKDSIDHPAYGGSDDVANAVAGAIDLIISKPVSTTNAMPVLVGDVKMLDKARDRAMNQVAPDSNDLPRDEDQPTRGDHQRFKLFWGWGGG
jgi:hypothetical protein